MTAVSIADHRQPAGLDRPLVVLVEADARLSSFLDRALAAAGYRVERTADSLRALAMIEERSPDVVLLDLALPGATGLDLVRQLRTGSGVPIIMLSVADSAHDCVAGLDAGADDYLARPFERAELLARLRAVLRGRALATCTALATMRRGSLFYTDLRLDQDTREVWRGQRRVKVRNRGFELLAYFMRHPERVISRRELLEEVWGYEFLGDSNVIDVTLSNVRQVLEMRGEPRLIQTVRSLGYMLHARLHVPE